MRCIRLQVDEHCAGAPPRTTVLYVPEKPDGVDAPTVTAAVRRILDGVAVLERRGVPDPRWVLAACLVELAADEAAYEREAARRGVLAL